MTVKKKSPDFPPTSGKITGVGRSAFMNVSMGNPQVEPCGDTDF